MENELGEREIVTHPAFRKRFGDTRYVGGFAIGAGCQWRCLRTVLKPLREHVKQVIDCVDIKLHQQANRLWSDAF